MTVSRGLKIRAGTGWAYRGMEGEGRGKSQRSRGGEGRGIMVRRGEIAWKRRGNQNRGGVGRQM